MNEEFDEEMYWRELAQSRLKDEQHLQEPIKVRMKIFLEGFNYDGDNIDIAAELKIQRVPIPERDNFITRAESISYKSFHVKK